ncbi:MAG: CinA family nicotinamide mononucleotide deamidase-related protein [Nitrospinota bacterium]
MKRIQAEVVAIGTEILLGDLIDTNSAYIAQKLKEIGLNLFFKSAVGDNRRRLASVLRRAHRRSQIVITTGGLGPTIDDVTREAVADVMGVELEFRQELYDYIEAYFRRRGFTMSENNRKQAYVPRGALALENPRGTAPSFICEDGLGVIIALPGVPREMHYLMEHRVIPYLREKFSLREVIKTKVLRTCAIGESRLDSMIADLFRNSSNPTIALLARPGQVDVRITAKAGSAARAEAMIGELEAGVRERIGPYVYGEGEESLEEAVGRLLLSNGKTLSLLETSTGGAIAQRLASISGAQRFFLRAMVALSAERVAEALGIKDAPPADDFAALADAASRALGEACGAGLSLAVVGPNPPVGIEPERSREAPPVKETCFSLSGPKGQARFRQKFGGDERFIQARATVFALDMVRRYLLFGPSGVTP